MPRKLSIRILTFFSFPAFVAVLELLLYPQDTLVQGRDPDINRSKFLYSDPDGSSHPVKEYQIHHAIGDLHHVHEGKNHHLPGPDEEHVKVVPFFLKAENAINNGPRVVEFYSPWCGHCQEFKHRYIEVANDVIEYTSSGVGKQEQAVDFHAISCSEHHKICQEQSIMGYPTILAYPGGSAVAVKLDKRFSTASVLHALNIKYIDNKKKKDAPPLPRSIPLEPHDIAKQKQKVPHLKSIDYNILKRTRTNTFTDAALSFTFALKTSIYQDDNNQAGIYVENGDYKSPLSPDKREVFIDWINLLYWTLPTHTWKVHTLVNDLRTHFEEVLDSKSKLQEIVYRHHDVVNENLADRNFWTESCSKGEDGHGYLCGLWNLLHIVSIGVAEHHTAVLGDRSSITTGRAASTIRHYIEHFLGCTICQDRFVGLYDKTCGSAKTTGRCKRFRQPFDKRHQQPLDPSSWTELALWLWEVHNDVNFMVLKDEADRESRVLSKEEKMSVIWPSIELCSNCWGPLTKSGERSNKNYDKERMYAFLKTQYWPAGVHHRRFVVLDAKKDDAENHHDYGDYHEFLDFAQGPFGLSIALFSGVQLFFWIRRRRRFEQIGRDKRRTESIGVISSSNNKV